MGECGRMQSLSYATSVADDMSVARDIARRFEQLETQWLSFQKKSAKWEPDKDTLRKVTGSLPRSRLQDHPVPSPASSYSNPLFTNHSSLRSSCIGEKASSASSRTGSPYATALSKSDRLSFSTRHKPKALSTSEQDGNVSKDDNSSSQVSPLEAQSTHSTPLVSSPPTADAKPSKSLQLSPPFDDVSVEYSKPKIPAFYYDKPSLSPTTAALKCSTGNEQHVSTSLSRLSSLTESRKGCERNLSLQGDVMETCPPHPSSQGKVPSREYAGHQGGLVESFTGALSTSKPAASDPATYSSGKGPPGLQISSVFDQLEQTDGAHCDHHQPCPSRSPPPCTSRTSTTETELQLDTLSYAGGLSRSVSWRVLADRGILSEGFLPQKVLPSEIGSEVSRIQSQQIAGLDATDLPSKKENVLKLEVQIDKKDVSEMENLKLGERLGRVNWELRLSKREAALRIAEERLLEEQQKLSETQLSVARCEEALLQREQAIKHDKEASFKVLQQHKGEMAETVKSMETGKAVMKKLRAALKEVLLQLEQKEKVLQSAWVEVSDSSDTGSLVRNHSFGFEPDLSARIKKTASFDGVSLLAAEGKCEEWCTTVIGICERLVAFMGRETHLQKWAIILEREGVRMSKMEEEMAKAKEAATERSARAEAMILSAKEQTSRVEDESVKLAQERESLVLWVTHLQERRKAVTECEREAAASLAEVQKKAADLFVHESCIDGRALEISALQEELRATSQRLHDDQEVVNRERNKVQEKLRQVAARERDADSKLLVIKKLQEELDTQKEQLEREKLAEEKKKERLVLAHRETEARLGAKEMALRELEKELVNRDSAGEEMANNLSEREKMLKSLQKQLEQERLKIREMMTDLERDKVRLKEAEEAIAEAHISKKNADEAWERTAKERREAADYLKSVEERVMQWEDRLRLKEKELQQQQKTIQEVESQAREEQEQSEALHAKLVLEQETWTEELKAKQESLAKRSKILETKEAEIKNDLEKLTEERRLAIDEIKRFAEMEARAWAAERDLQTKHDEHLQEVRKHAKEYHAHVEDLEIAKKEVEKEFEEVHAKKQELQIWQREAEETLQNRIDSFIQGKEELTAQIQELKKLQVDIEQAGAQIIDRVAELDQASTRLERQRHKVETSKSKLEVLADKLVTHQEVLKRREGDLAVQETKLVALQSGVKRMAAEATTKEKNLRFREQAVIDSENDLHELEARLANERKDLEKMIAEVEQHAATLKEETASAEESTRNRTREELLIEEKRENLQAKERELAGFEMALKKKAKSLEEHGQTISKLEMQVKERLQRAADLEEKSSELEKGLDKLKEEQSAIAYQRESLTMAKSEVQRAAASQRTECLQWKADQERHGKEDIERKAWLREEMEKHRTEMMAVLLAREAAIDAREAKAGEREAALLKLERQAKEQIERDAQELRQQLTGARAELEDQRHYVDEKRKAAEAIAATIEERETKLKLKEKEVDKRENLLMERERKSSSISDGTENRDPLICSKEIHVQGNGVGAGADYCRLQELMSWRLSGTEIAAEMVHETDKEQGGDPLENGSREMQAWLFSQKQEEEGMGGRLKQIDETFQKESAKILQERANLKLQQQDLEETRKAVQEVKVTLTAQLKATKQMVADASLTAQNASREREALEEERKRLSKAQKDAETAFTVKESKLAIEAKQLENMKCMLEHEKAQAMEIIQQAAKRAVDAERARAMGSTTQWDSSMMHKEIQCDADLKERERELSSAAGAIRREKMSLEDERARVKMLHAALEREQTEQCHVNMKQAAKAEAQIKDAENRLAWEEIHKRREETRLIGEAHGWHPNSEIPLKEKRTILDQEFAFPTLNGVGNLGGVLGESSSRPTYDYQPSEILGPNHNTNNNIWDDSFGSMMLLSSPSSSMTAAAQISPEKMMADFSGVHMHEGSGVPSRKRLENVMTSLMHARQASRSRLQRTENALLAFPPSAGFTAQVQQALNALSARLSLMEQIEEGLASHLRKAYETETPESEGVIVDKVQLLCRMEEQQSLRAEWEEDMQRQLETISMLQAASRNSSNFNTPVKMTNSSPPNMNDWQNHGSSGSNGLQGGKSHAGYDMGGRIGNNGVGPPVPQNHSAGGSKPSRQFSSPEWNTTFEPLLGVDSKGLSYSPLVDFNYLNSPAEQHQPEFGGREGEGHERSARRKLHLSPPHVAYS